MKPEFVLPEVVRYEQLVEAVRKLYTACPWIAVWPFTYEESDALWRDVCNAAGIEFKERTRR